MANVAAAAAGVGAGARIDDVPCISLGQTRQE